MGGPRNWRLSSLTILPAKPEHAADRRILGDRCGYDRVGNPTLRSAQGALKHTARNLKRDCLEASGHCLQQAGTSKVD